MHEVEERKKKFVFLLHKLLNECQGVKGELANKLDIKPSTLTPWLQGKIDPASLEILVFNRIAKIAGHTTDSLVQFLKIIEIQKEQKIPQEQFKILIEEMLVTQSRKQLGKRLNISPYTIGNWLSPERSINPENLPINTFAAVAIERGWTIERLLSYLNLIKENEEKEEDILAFIQSKTLHLSLANRLKLLSWLSSNFEKEFSNFNLLTSNLECQKNFSNKKLCIILEQEDITIASNYANKLGIHFQIFTENITLATISQIREIKEDFDLIIFDIQNNLTSTLALIDRISFNGDIVIFVSQELEAEVRSQLLNKVTDIVVKPLDWESLKDKPYFAQI
ncbi:MAG: hypothetical protein ACFBSE_13995 [Prochloraceae cyanobacterium]